MNYFFGVDGLADFSLKLSEKNQIDLSDYLALGQFINNETMPEVIYYVGTSNSNASVSDLNNSDFILNVSGGFLVSAKVKNIVESSFPNECQFIKAEIEYKGRYIENFYSINIFNKINCYDFDLSEYEYIEGVDSYEFERIVLKQSPLKACDATYNIVRSKEDNKIVVSEEFKNKVESNCIQNLFFESEFDMFS